jgi:hypothetical protein
MRRSRKPFRASGSDEGSNPSPSAFRLAIRPCGSPAALASGPLESRKVHCFRYSLANQPARRQALPALPVEVVGLTGEPSERERTSSLDEWSLCSSRMSLRTAAIGPRRRPRATLRFDGDALLHVPGALDPLLELEGRRFTTKPQRLLVRFFPQRQDRDELAHKTASSPTWLSPERSVRFRRAARDDQDRAAGDADEAIRDAPEER